MSEPCQCGDACDWDEYDQPTYWTSNGALTRVTFYYICLNCEVSWNEHHHIERTYVHISNVEENR